MTKFRKITFSTLALTVALIATSSAAFAHERGDAKGPHGNRGAHFFKKMDTNNDGKITKSEAQTASDARFAKMDLNHDKVITKEEANKAHENFQAEKQQEREAHFKEKDANKNGKLERSEVRMPDSAFTAADVNKDGALTKEELRTAFEKHRKNHPHGEKGGPDKGGPDKGKHADHMFQRMDDNADGKVNQAEARAQASSFFQKMDQDKNNVLTPDELKHGRKHHEKDGKPPANNPKKTT